MAWCGGVVAWLGLSLSLSLDVGRGFVFGLVTVLFLGFGEIMLDLGLVVVVCCWWFGGWRRAGRVVMSKRDEGYEPGCYVGGHWGQYGPDRLAEQFGTEEQCAEMARLRAEIESEDYDPMLSTAHEIRLEIADDIENELNDKLAGSGMLARWHDGEFFIAQYCGADWSEDCAGEGCTPDECCDCYCHWY